jgi:hypothetical protein
MVAQVTPAEPSMFPKETDKLALGANACGRGRSKRA